MIDFGVGLWFWLMISDFQAYVKLQQLYYSI